VDLRARLVELSGLRDPAGGVVSAYLDTGWHDEHQRDRIRVFVKNERRRLAAAGPPAAAPDDLAWVEAQTEALVAQTLAPGAGGAALFACRAIGLREVHPVPGPLACALVVGDRPFLRPLADVVEGHPPAVVVFVDGRSARLVPLGVERPGGEVRLESDVPGHHRRGGWALLAESRYRRHIDERRGRHLDAVADAVAAAVGDARDGVLVLAGEPGTVADLRRHLAAGLQARVRAELTAGHHEPAATLAARATEALARAAAAAEGATLDDLLVEAAKGGRAVAGLTATLEAVARGAVHRLYLARTFRATGTECPHCGVIQAGDGARCRLCGRATAPVELGEAMIARVLDNGGGIELVGPHAGLAAGGGVAARVRYPAGGERR
jgi:peptide subunit release factor 1 (eRF1)